MGRGKRLSDDEQAKIRVYLEHDTPKKEIAAKLGRSYCVIDNFSKDMDGYAARKRLGRRSSLSERDVRRIFQEASKTGQSSEQVRKSTGVPVTSRRIRQLLNSSDRFQYVKRKINSTSTKELQEDEEDKGEEETECELGNNH